MRRILPPYCLLFICAIQSRRMAHVLLLLALAGLISCTGLKPVPKGKYLYDGATLDIENEKQLVGRKRLRAELEGVIKPKPNQKFLWARPSLVVYSRFAEPKKEKGLNYWLKYKVGEPPVMMGAVDPAHIAQIMANRLYHKGYFYAKVEQEIIRRKKTAKVTYRAYPGHQYQIAGLTYPNGNSLLVRDMQQMKTETLLKENTPYSLDLLKKERERIETGLKEKGYYYFSPDFLIFKVDSTLGDFKLHIYLEVKPETPKAALQAYSLEKVYIAPDFELENYSPDTTFYSVDSYELDSTLKTGYIFLDNTHAFKAPPVLNSVLLRPDSLYSQSDHQSTLRQLMGLGTYQFATARFFRENSSSNTLRALIALTPKKRHSFSIEANAVAKTNNFAGPGIKLSYKNRNSFKGAEQFSIDFNGRYELQVGGGGNSGSAIELRGELGFRLPRIFPLPYSRKKREFVPYTYIKGGLGFFRRDSVAGSSTLYTLASAFINYRYNWRVNTRVSHSFQLMDVSYTDLIDASKSFREYLDQNPSVKRSFEEQFVIGSNYTFTYNALPAKLGANGVFFSGGIGSSGNLVSAVHWVLTGEWPSAEMPVTIINDSLPYSQFVRFTPEFRYYQRIGRTTLASRLQIGVAIPYGNSVSIPYIKQFFVGGANSLRAFRARSVGPGGHVSENSGTFLVDQTGDIKLEGDIEYRFKVASFLDLALFCDAGNVWLVNPDENRPLADFQFDRFYKEIAVGTGLGIRVDLSVIVVRFDFAFPLRDPSLPEEERWVIKDIDLGSPSWRSENLILNFSIGYPF